MEFKIYDPKRGTIPPDIKHTKLKTRKLPCASGNDIDFFDGLLYIIDAKNGGCFRIVDPEFPLKTVSEMKNLGNLRQIEVSSISGRKLAAITAREYGMYLIDVTNNVSPFVACHYDTVELATGIAFCGKYVFIACRNFGVEVIDISEPEHPRHVSVIRAGEVQSIKVQNGIMYTGSWGEGEVNIFDVSCLDKPKHLSTIKTNGRTDGVFIYKNRLFVAFGHHLPPVSGKKPNEYGYGRGNGFAIYDISNPSTPKELSVTMFAHRYYCCNYDMWDINVCNNYAILSHTFNGIWIYDVSNPAIPQLCDFVGIKADKKLSELITINDFIMSNIPPIMPFDFEKTSYAPVQGVALGNDKLWIAADCNNLYESEGQYFSCSTQKDESRLTESNTSFYKVNPGENLSKDIRILDSVGQVHAVTTIGERLYAACGNGGIRCYDLEISKEFFAYQTDGYINDLHSWNKMLVASAGSDGVYIFEPTDKTLNVVGRFYEKACCFTQAVPNGKFVICQANDQHMYILDISNPAVPVLVTDEEYAPGLLYYRQITEKGVEGKYFGCYWNGNDTHWYDLSGDEPIRLSSVQGRLQFRNGQIGLEKPYMALSVCDDGYVIHDIRERIILNSAKKIIIPGIHFTGKPQIAENILAVNDRICGYVTFLDISDIKNPRLIRQMRFSGHPDIVFIENNIAYIPLGHQGICSVKIN